jgi:hypothetical protein
MVRVIAWVCIVACVALEGRTASAQGRRSGGPATATTGQFIPFDRRNSDPLAGPLVSGAPFSADATTSVVQTLGDGTRIEQKSIAKYYRDGTGRVRREQTVLGLENLNAAAAARTIITFDSVPGDQMPYLLDPDRRTARQMPRGIALSNAAGALSTFRLRTSSGNGAGDLIDVVTGFQGLTVARRGLPNDARPMEEDLGTRQIDGLKATGRRTTTTIPQGFARAESVDFVALFRPAHGSGRVSVDQHRAQRAAGGSLCRAAGLHRRAGDHAGARRAWWPHRGARVDATRRAQMICTRAAVCISRA